MPIYEFKCPICSVKREMQTNYNASDRILDCLFCEIPMKKQVSKPAGIHFKGSGFYETDYKGK